MKDSEMIADIDPSLDQYAQIMEKLQDIKEKSDRE